MGPIEQLPRGQCMLRFRHAILALLSALALSMCGCGPSDGIQKVIVQGTITFEGEPLASGQIMFYPIEETQGPVSIALIEQGKYIAELKGGVPVGTHRVKIEGFRRPTAAPPGMNLEELGREQYLPPRYNSQSDMTTKLNADESPATRDYDLTR